MRSAVWVALSAAAKGIKTTPVILRVPNTEKSLNVLEGYSGGVLPRQGFAVTTTFRLILQLELALVLFEEVAQILRPVQEL